MGTSINVGANISKYRRERNLTQKELGVMVGVTDKSIAAYEAGNISVEALGRVANALGVTPNMLFGIVTDKDELLQLSALCEELALRLCGIIQQISHKLHKDEKNRRH